MVFCVEFSTFDVSGGVKKPENKMSEECTSCVCGGERRREEEDRNDLWDETSKGGRTKGRRQRRLRIKYQTVC